MESTCMPINRQMDEEDVITHTHTHRHTHTGILFSNKKEWNVFIYDIMDGPKE